MLGLMWLFLKGLFSGRHKKEEAGLAEFYLKSVFVVRNQIKFMILLEPCKRGCYSPCGVITARTLLPRGPWTAFWVSSCCTLFKLINNFLATCQLKKITLNKISPAHLKCTSEFRSGGLSVELKQRCCLVNGLDQPLRPNQKLYWYNLQNFPLHFHVSWLEHPWSHYLKD